MKKIAEKVALASLIAISLIFVLICVLTYLNIIPLRFNDAGVFVVDWVVVVILLILAAIWLILGAYLLYMNFAQRNMLRYVMLYSDRNSSTKATSKVIKKLAVAESNQISGVKIRKIHISANEHLGLNLKLQIEVANDDVAYSVDTLRYLLEDKYREVLGIEFSAMDFQVRKVKTSYKPDIGKAESHADELRKKRRACNGTTCHMEAHEDEIGQTDSTNTMPISSDIEVETVTDSNEIPTTDIANDEGREHAAPTEKKMYGTPDSPLTDDIVVEIHDEEEPVQKTEVKKKKKKS